MKPVGVVLAGGASSRMGHDKALVPVLGLPMAEHAVRVLGAVCSQVWVVRRDGQLPWPGTGRVVLEPASAPRHPLTGLAYAMEQGPEVRWWMVAPCDMPRVTVQAAQALWRHRGAHGAVLADPAGRQSLWRCLRAQDPQQMLRLAREGIRLHNWPRPLRIVERPAEELVNLNGPADLFA